MTARWEVRRALEEHELQTALAEGFEPYAVVSETMERRSNYDNVTWQVPVHYLRRQA